MRLKRLGVCQKAPKGLRFSGVIKPILNTKRSRLEETRNNSSAGQYHSYGEAWWWQHHAVRMFFNSRDWRLVRIEAKMHGAKYRDP